MKTSKRIAAVVACIGLCTATSTGTAAAKAYDATGRAKADRTTKVGFELKANAKKGVLSRAVSIGRFTAENVPFKCSATGYAGRADYVVIDSFTEPFAIAADGRFEAVYENSAGGELIRRDALKGKVTGRGRFALVTGTFKSERSEGGLRFNNCATPKVAFKAKVRL